MWSLCAVGYFADLIFPHGQTCQDAIGKSLNDCFQDKCSVIFVGEGGNSWSLLTDPHPTLWPTLYLPRGSFIMLPLNISLFIGLIPPSPPPANLSDFQTPPWVNAQHENIT